MASQAQNDADAIFHFFHHWIWQRANLLAGRTRWPRRSPGLHQEIAITGNPPWPFLRRNRRIPGFSTSRVVVGMTIVDGYPASLMRSDGNLRAGRSFPGLVLMRGLKSIMYKFPRLMGIYSFPFARATPALKSSLFSSRSAAPQRSRSPGYRAVIFLPGFSFQGS